VVGSRPERDSSYWGSGCLDCDIALASGNGDGAVKAHRIDVFVLLLTGDQGSRVGGFVMALYALASGPGDAI
jgi:hypothetical protein